LDLGQAPWRPEFYFRLHFRRTGRFAASHSAVT
jgi:hypothetical protein